MKREYKYLNARNTGASGFVFTALILIGMVMGLILIGLAMSQWKYIPNEELITTAIISVVIALPYYLYAHGKGSFKAGKNAVVFKHLIIRRKISYKDIKDINYEVCIVDDSSGSDGFDCYAEKLTIKTEKKTYEFWAEAAKKPRGVKESPEVLEERFRDCEFSRLKRYIEKNIDSIEETNKENKTMKNKYIYLNRSGDVTSLYAVPGLMAVVMLIISQICTDDDDFELMLFISAVILIPLVLLMLSSKASYKTDEEGVSFRHMLRFTRINYKDIRSIEREVFPVVGNKFDILHDRDLHGRNIRFAERITIETVRRTYVFCAGIQTDFSDLSASSEELIERFGGEKLAMLEKHIAENIKSNTAEYAEGTGLVERFDLEYTNRKHSDSIRMRLTASAISLLMLIFIVCCSNNDFMPFLAVAFLVFTGCLIWLLLESFVFPVYYKADEKAVVFHKHMKKININYDDISGICVQQYNKPLPEGGISYIQRLSILTEDDIFVFDANVYTDLNAVSADFGSMQKRFDDAALSRLKKYILYNRSQFISGNRIETDPKLLPLMKIEWS